MRNSVYKKDQTDSRRGQSSRILPGAPPEIFKEWDDPHVYGEEPNPWTQKNERYSSDDGDVLQSVYGHIEIPTFGPQYVTSAPSHISTQDGQAERPTTVQVAVSNPYEEMMRNADTELERPYLEASKSPTGDETQAISTFVACIYFCLISLPTVFSSTAHPPMPLPKSQRALQKEATPSAKPFVPPTAGSSSCIICTEDFSSIIRRPKYISLACLHESSICSDCLCKSIKSDLDHKVWNQIKCPECQTLLIYEDIKRHADPETFSRYVLCNPSNLASV